MRHARDHKFNHVGFAHYFQKRQYPLLVAIRGIQIHAGLNEPQQQCFVTPFRHFNPAGMPKSFSQLPSAPCACSHATWVLINAMGTVTELVPVREQAVLPFPSVGLPE